MTKLSDIIDKIYVKPNVFIEEIWNINNVEVESEEKVRVAIYYNCYFLLSGYKQLYEHLHYGKDFKVKLEKNTVVEVVEYQDISVIPHRKRDLEDGQKQSDK